MEFHADNAEDANQSGDPIREFTLSLHTFSDLKHVHPLTFLYLLKECYNYGTLKGKTKFDTLQQQVNRDLLNSPPPGPFTFIIHCLYIMPLYGDDDVRGLCKWLLSSLSHFKSLETIQTDYLDAKQLATQLVLKILDHAVSHRVDVLLQLVVIFEIELSDIAQALCDEDLEKAKALLEHYIRPFLQTKSYTAVTLMNRYSMQCCDESVLLGLFQANQYKAAESFAPLLPKPLVCLLVQKFIDIKHLKAANDIVKKCNLTEEFPYVSYQCKESELKKFAEKGLWEKAEMKAKEDANLVEFLVYLAMEAGCADVVDEFCMRYSLHDFIHSCVPVELCNAEYLALDKLDFGDIVWVDDANGLESATKYIEGCKIVGMDCEWKSTVKGSKPSKVSIIQIASEKRAFIIDLIKLCREEPDCVNDCFSRIMCSSKILKLGYNLGCDLYNLSHCYGELNCFKSYKMLLDLQMMFTEKTGGLSGLSERVLGAGLDKTWRDSDWEQRPLSDEQIEYAALDAAVLVAIFRQQHLGIHKGDKIKGKSFIETSLVLKVNP